MIRVPSGQRIFLPELIGPDIDRRFHPVGRTRVVVPVETQDVGAGEPDPADIDARRAGEQAQIAPCLIAGGARALRERPFVSFITLIISPFKIDDNYGEITCYLAEQGLPVVVPTEPICGTTSPITAASWPQ